MRILRFEKADISKGFLILVNPLHPLKDDIPKENLVPANSDAAFILLERQTAKMLSKVMFFLRCERKIIPISGYRTLQDQQKIYADSLCEHGKDFTKKYVAIPGCSEHQTGFAVDLALNRETIDFIRPDFPYAGICGRFRDISIQYGFIERYPAGREQITSISHEPWHFRYVGYPHSEVMGELTLEEYTDYLKQFSYQSNHLKIKINNCEYEIFYVPIQNGKEAIINIPEGIPYQVSGNNVDGVVVTLWKDRL
ncbi:MAG: D-alanyl-D-alanine carboxypeptidase family protein [Ruminiclostridium sp.]|jgi:D-alanyl-D-alanine dipeptidase/carboxypeptidase|nr:D-alanyl-D-alanine carboxypeptidase family protein [Ruminiclostridium sp.]